MGDVIQFPKIMESESLKDLELEISKDVMRNVIGLLSAYGYNIEPDEKLFDDIGLIFNMFYAMLLRNSNQIHVWHGIMDDMICFLKKDLCEN